MQTVAIAARYTRSMVTGLPRLCDRRASRPSGSVSDGTGLSGPMQNQEPNEHDHDRKEVSRP